MWAGWYMVRFAVGGSGHGGCGSVVTICIAGRLSWGFINDWVRSIGCYGIGKSPCNFRMALGTKGRFIWV